MLGHFRDRAAVDADPEGGRSRTGDLDPRRDLHAFGVGVLLSVSLAACATTTPPVALVSHMPAGERVDPPSGFAELCQREPVNCQAPAGAEAGRLVVDLTPERRLLLESVNRRINRQIKDARDQDLYGQEEFWVNPLAADGPLAGDCEDYALAKRDLLIAQGWPGEALFIAVGHHQRLGLHAVLVARTSDGDLVLDARSPWLQRFQDAPYVWVKRQLASYSRQWVRTHAVRPDADLLVGATATTARPAGGSLLEGR